MDYHADRFRDSSLMLYRNGRLVALFPACVSAENTISSHEGLSYGGLLVTSGNLSDQTMFCLAEVMKFYKQEGYDYLILRQMPAIYSTVPCDEVNYALYLAGATVMRINLNSAVDLAEQHRLPLQRRRMTGVKTAIRHGVTVVEAADFEGFWDTVLIPNLQARHSAMPVHSVEEIRRLSRANPGCIRQFNALYEGRIMAGCTVFDVGRVAKAQYFSGCDEGRANGSLDYLVFELMNNYFKDRDYFDFGNSNTGNGRQLNSGLLAWKEGFGARSYAQCFCRIETGAYSRILDVFA